MYNKKLLVLPILFFLAVVAVFVYFVLYNPAESEKENEYDEYPLPEVTFIDNVRRQPSLESVENGSLYLSPTFKIVNPKIDLPYFEYNREDILTEDKVQSLAELVGLTNSNLEIIQSEGSGKLIKMSNEEQSINAYVDLNFLQYSNTSIINEEKLPSDFTSDKFFNIAQNVVNIMSTNNQNFIYTNYAYFVANPNEVALVNKPTEANYIEYIFKSSVNELPIIDRPDFLSANEIKVLIDSKENIIRVIYQPIGEVGNQVGTLPIKAQEQIEQEIKEQKPIIVNTEILMGVDLLKTTIREASLGYYAVNDKLIPVYIMKGITSSDEGDTGESLLILEAVDKSYYEEQFHNQK